MKKTDRKAVKVDRGPAIMTFVINSAKEGARIAAAQNTTHEDMVAFSHSLVRDASNRAEEAFKKLPLMLMR